MTLTDLVFAFDAIMHSRGPFVDLEHAYNSAQDALKCVVPMSVKAEVVSASQLGTTITVLVNLSFAFGRDENFTCQYQKADRMRFTVNTKPKSMGI